MFGKINVQLCTVYTQRKCCIRFGSLSSLFRIDLEQTHMQVAYSFDAISVFVLIGAQFWTNLPVEFHSEADTI